jgi:hypothetical protein
MPCSNRARVALALLAMVLVVGSVSSEAHTSAGARVVPTARFVHPPSGWKFFSDEPVLLGPAGAQTSVYATSWDFRPSTPGGWGSNLPSNGAGFSISLTRHTNRATGRSCGYPVNAHDYRLYRRLTIRFRDLVHGPSDDNPRHLAFSLRANLRHEYLLDLFLTFGSRTPTMSLQRAVDEALSAIVLPAWPKGC